jgi:quercetin dioxygenase-like cupin family protein
MNATSAARTTVVRVKDANVVSRGNGVETTLLIGREVFGAAFTSGLTRFPPGAGAPEHFHNCDEQVTILEGRPKPNSTASRRYWGARDTTFIPAGKPHRFTNIGSKPLVIMWILRR